MSAETITTAIFLITAVVATAVLVNAIYPVIYSTAGTFQSSTHDADTRLRTDFKIVATNAKEDGTADIYLKNIGSQRISATTTDVKNWDIFFGKIGEFNRIPYFTTSGWYETFDGDISYDINENHFWDPGETVKISIVGSALTKGDSVYFQLSLPNGIWRSTEFPVS